MSRPQDSIAREALSRAAQVLGGPAALAKRLGIPLEQVQRWIRGEEAPPPKVVFAALALIEAGKPKS